MGHQRRIAGIVLCALCAAVVMAVGASAAAAQAPEFGKCIRKAAKEGAGFAKKPNCVDVTATKAKYEWAPGPGAANKFTYTERFGYSPKFHRCEAARGDETQAEQREAEAALASEPNEREALEAEARAFRVTAKQDRELAGESLSGCEKLIAKETARSPVVLKTGAHRPLVCADVAGSGEYTGAKTIGELQLVFSECSTEGVACESSGASAGEIQISTLDGELGFIEQVLVPTKDKVGVKWFPSSGETWTEYACEAETVLVTGSLIHNVNSDSMVTVGNESASSAKEKQNPVGFEGQGPSVLMSSTDGGPSQESALTLKLFKTNEEAIEINTIV